VAKGGTKHHGETLAGKKYHSPKSLSGYNGTVKDISMLFAPNRGFSGSANSMVALKWLYFGPLKA